MLIWYAKNFKRISEGDQASHAAQSQIGLLNHLQNDSLFYMQNSLDSTTIESTLLRVAQLIF